ncbi:oligosaccharide flippase family protein [Methylocaldum sp. RMAD-M]|jgi:O-antigen/teichoic acid export membrane protein|uniref:oligosaccharide flippase family protein n=1 Tax=Methylocaldum sp. RMAD-M TaxID=2806557 RepID=UPI000A321EBD|nr:oligosaccharide flippase family protein [Methylocaldum sp. RMAD-M]MBP1152811.1 O-antigen/teichoic acid export membrane protein [Methylocaldum sp. RMAD-M]
MSVRRNTLLNLVGRLAPIVVTLLTVPPYLRLIGEERYGVLTICWMLLGYFGLFDLGLGQATAQRMASLRNASDEERESLLWTALLLSGGLGLLAGLVFWLVGQLLLTHFIPSGGSLRAETLSALPWLAACLPISFVSSPLSGALAGRERFVALNSTAVVGIFLGQILPLTVAWLGNPELVWLIPAVLMARLVTTLMLLRRCRHHVPLGRRPSIKTAWMRPLFSYGGWIALNAAIGSLLAGIERGVIAAISGAKAVTLYTVPYSLAIRLNTIPLSLMSAVFPRFAAESDAQQTQLKRQALRAIAAVMTPLIAAGLFGMEPFLALWIDPDFAARAARSGEILLLGIWVNAFAQVPWFLLQARGRPDLVTKLYLLQLLPYLGLLYGSLVLWEAMGAALAWSVRAAVDALMLFAAAKSTWDELRPILKSGVWITLAASTVFLLQPGNASRWTSAAVLLLFIALWSWRMAPTSMKHLLPMHRFQRRKTQMQQV